MKNLPSWFDFDTVYTRMQARQLLPVRAYPGSIPGHILSLGVFGRAEQFEGKWFDINEFIDMYCKFKKLDRNELMFGIEEYLKSLGQLDTDPVTLIKELSRF